MTHLTEKDFQVRPLDCYLKSSILPVFAIYLYFLEAIIKYWNRFEVSKVVRAHKWHLEVTLLNYFWGQESECTGFWRISFHLVLSNSTSSYLAQDIAKFYFLSLMVYLNIPLTLGFANQLGKQYPMSALCFVRHLSKVFQYIWSPSYLFIPL